MYIGKQLINHLKKLGPGLLFAGAAVGVSHLVYSTKAGALYGFGLIWIVLICNLVKYPFFKFAPLYTIHKKESLLQGYKRLHPIIPYIFLVVTVLTMFTIIAAVSIVTASILSTIMPNSISIIYLAIFVLLFTSSILLLGSYSILDKLMKGIIVTLTGLTILTVLYAGLHTKSNISFAQWLPDDENSILFLIAFIGWMPAPLDLSVWHSMWTVKKIETDQVTADSVKLDFNIGYWGTTLLALLFLSLGALVMQPSGEVFSPKGSVFANQLINLYTSTLGDTLGLFVGFAALITMFSTTITCLDAIPRSLCNLHEIIQNKAIKNSRKVYLMWVFILCSGAILILALFLDNMSSFLQIATILSFVTAPFFAIVNYCLMIKFVDTVHLSRWMHILSIAGMIFLTVFCIYYLYIIIG